MLELVTLQDNQRGERLENIVGIESFKALEDQLANQRRLAEQEMPRLTQATAGDKAELRREFGLDGDSVPSREACWAALNALMEGLSLAPVADGDAVASARATVQAELSSGPDTERIAAAQNVSRVLDSLPGAMAKAMEALHDYGNACKSARQAEADAGSALLPDLLRAGAELLDSGAELADCPLCEQPFDRSAVQCRIRERLTKFEAVREATAAEDTCRTDYVSALGECLQASSQLIPALTVLDAANEGCFILKLRSRWTERQRVSRNREDSTAVSNEADALGPPTEQDLEALRSIVLPILEADTATHAVGLAKANSCLAAAAEALPRLESRLVALHQLEAGISALQRLSTHAVIARKEAMQAVLDGAAKTAAGYYDVIHPGEELGGVEYRTASRGKSSVKLVTDFYDTSGDPRGRYSEGHLDSLGLCLFLALRRLSHDQDPAFSLLVLDDVMHSVDANHRERTARLVFDEFKDHQVVITTHDRRWFEYLQELQPTGTTFAQARLVNWSLEHGPQFGDHRSDYQWLVDNPGGQPRDRITKAARLLEYLLQELCERLDINVPYRKSGRQTLDPMWRNLSSAAAKLDDFPRAVLTGLNGCLKDRNVAVHYNELASDVQDSEAQAFVTAVLALRDATFCSYCRQFIRDVQVKKKSEMQWQCGCPARRGLLYSKAAVQAGGQ